MKIKNVMQFMEEIAPLSYAEHYDNVGLLIGNKDTTVKGDASSMKWITTSLQDEISALNSKKSSWAAKELDPTDTTAYDVIAQPVD